MSADDQREQVEASEATDRLRTSIRDLAGREAVVIDAVCEGRSAKAIALQLSISPASVSLIKRQAVGRLAFILTGGRGTTR